MNEEVVESPTERLIGHCRADLPEWLARKFDFIDGLHHHFLERQAKAEEKRIAWLKRAAKLKHIIERQDTAPTFAEGRQTVLATAQGKCERCGQSTSNSRDLVVHHLEPCNSSYTKPDPAHLPEKLIVLCGRCHKAAHAILDEQEFGRLINFEEKPEKLPEEQSLQPTGVGRRRRLR